MTYLPLTAVDYPFNTEGGTHPALVSWSNANNVLLADGSYASVFLTCDNGFGSASAQINCTFDFSLIPDSVIINSLSVDFLHYESNINDPDPGQAFYLSALPHAELIGDQIVSYSTESAFNEASLTPVHSISTVIFPPTNTAVTGADLKSANFHIRIAAIITGAPAGPAMWDTTVYLDSITLEVISDGIKFIVTAGDVPDGRSGSDIYAYDGISFTSVGLGNITDGGQADIDWAGKYQGDVWVAHSGDGIRGVQSTDGSSWTTRSRNASIYWVQYGEDGAGNTWRLEATGDSISTYSIYKNDILKYTTTEGSPPYLSIPWMAFHPSDGSLVAFVIHKINPPNPYEVYVYYTIDGGDTWTQSTNLIPSNNDFTYFTVDYSYGAVMGNMAINSSGAMATYFSWWDNVANLNTNSIAYSTDGGASWGRVDLASADSFGFSGMVVSSGPRFVCAFGFYNGTEAFTKVYYSDSGASWTLATELHDLAVDGIFQPHGVWYNYTMDECWIIAQYYSYEVSGFLRKGVSNLSSWTNESSQIPKAMAAGNIISLSFPGLNAAGGGGSDPAGPYRFIPVYVQGGVKFIPTYEDIDGNKFIPVYSSANPHGAAL